MSTIQCFGIIGFPCCVNESPPTETDGPPGTFAIARAAAAFGHIVTVITDDCNKGKQSRRSMKV
jgi:hypothetical protein